MDQNQVRLRFSQNPLHAQQSLGGDAGEGLLPLHNVQIVLGFQMENLHDRVQHLPVLAGEAAQTFKLRPAGQLLDQGAILMASGLVPNTDMTLILRLLICSPPSPLVSSFASSGSSGGRWWFRLKIKRKPMAPTTNTAPMRMRARPSRGGEHHSRQAQHSRQHVCDGHRLLLGKAHIDEAVVNIAPGPPSWGSGAWPGGG